MTSVSAKRCPCLLTTKIIFQYFDYIVHLETEFPCLLHRCLRTGPPSLSSLYPQVSTFPGLNLFFSLNYLFMAYLYNLKYPILAKKNYPKTNLLKKKIQIHKMQDLEKKLWYMSPCMSRLFTKIHLSRDWPLIYLKDDFQILQYLTANMFWFFLER